MENYILFANLFNASSEGPKPTIFNIKSGRLLKTLTNISTFFSGDKRPTYKNLFIFLFLYTMAEV